jgi:hypothetical protein
MQIVLDQQKINEKLCNNLEIRSNDLDELLVAVDALEAVFLEIHSNSDAFRFRLAKLNFPWSECGERNNDR